MRNHETTLERRRRQLEVIGKKLQRAIDQNDEAGQKTHRESLEATEQNIRELESAPEAEPARRRSRREG
jgi:hypothetical protein